MRSGGDGLHFRVSGDVMELFGQIVTSGDYLIVAHHYSPHGHLVCLVGFEGFANRLAHEINVVKLHGDKTT